MYVDQKWLQRRRRYIFIILLMMGSLEDWIKSFVTHNKSFTKSVRLQKNKKHSINGRYGMVSFRCDEFCMQRIPVNLIDLCCIKFFHCVHSVHSRRSLLFTHLFSYHHLSASAYKIYMSCIHIVVVVAMADCFNILYALAHMPICMIWHVFRAIIHLYSGIIFF